MHTDEIEIMNTPYRSMLLEDPIVAPLLATFLSALSQRMKAIRVAVHQADWREVARIAHQLAGSCGGYGFPEMGIIAARIEFFATEEKIQDHISVWVEKLERLSQAAQEGYVL